MTKLKRALASPVSGLLGAALVLGSFVVQNVGLASFLSESQRFDNVMAHYSRSYLSSIGHLNSYFIQGLATGSYDGTQLRKSADEHWAGYCSYLLSSSLGREDKIALVKTLRAAADAVRDIDTYNAYLHHVNQIEPQARTLSDQKYQELNEAVGSATRWFVGLNVLGAVLLLLHQFLKDGLSSAQQGHAAGRPQAAGG